MLLSEFFDKREVKRDANIKLTHYSNSEIPGTVCFVVNEQYLNYSISNKNVSAIITTEEFAERISESLGLVISPNPKLDFYRLHNYMFEHHYMHLSRENYIHPSAIISNTAIVGKYVTLHKDVVVDHFAIIEDYTIIQEGTYIGPNVVIGAKGLRNTMAEGSFMKVWDAGGVIVGMNCEILSNAIIQKSFNCEYTIIGNNTKISVKVNIGHGCRIGERTMISGNSQIAGNVRIGNDVWIGPSVTTAENITIGDKANIKLGSVVVKNVQSGAVISGNFAVDHFINVQAFAKARRK